MVEELKQDKVLMVPSEALDTLSMFDKCDTLLALDGRILR